MADKLYKVSEPIDLNYQAPNKQTGQTVIAEIFLPNKQKDIGNFPDVTLVEVGTTGTYRGVFTPNAQGTWQTNMHLQNGDGQVAKSYSVGGHNVDSVGTAVGEVDTKVIGVDGKVVGVSTAVGIVDDKVVAVDNKVEALGDVIGTVSSTTGSVGEGVDTIIADIAALDNKVGALDTPPMAF